MLSSASFWCSCIAVEIRKKQKSVPDPSSYCTVKCQLDMDSCSMANLFKKYSRDGSKYNDAAIDNFERNSSLFLETCEQADTADDNWHLPLSIMFTGQTRQCCFDVCKQKNFVSKSQNLLRILPFSNRNKPQPSFVKGSCQRSQNPCTLTWKRRHLHA